MQPSTCGGQPERQAVFVVIGHSRCMDCRPRHAGTALSCPAAQEAQEAVRLCSPTPACWLPVLRRSRAAAGWWPRRRPRWPCRTAPACSSRAPVRSPPAPPPAHAPWPSQLFATLSFTALWARGMGQQQPWLEHSHAKPGPEGPNWNHCSGQAHVVQQEGGAAAPAEEEQAVEGVVDQVPAAGAGALLGARRSQPQAVSGAGALKRRRFRRRGALHSAPSPWACLALPCGLQFRTIHPC